MYPAGSTIRATRSTSAGCSTPPPRRLRRQIGGQASELEQPRAGLRHRLVDRRGRRARRATRGAARSPGRPGRRARAPHLAGHADPRDRARVDLPGEQAQRGAGRIGKHARPAARRIRAPDARGSPARSTSASGARSPRTRRPSSPRCRRRSRRARGTFINEFLGLAPTSRTIPGLIAQEGRLCYTRRPGPGNGTKEALPWKTTSASRSRAAGLHAAGADGRRRRRGGCDQPRLAARGLRGGDEAAEPAAPPAEEPAGTEPAPPATPPATETVPGGGGGEVDSMAWVINGEAVSMDYALAYDFNTNCRNDEHLRAAAALQPRRRARAEPRRGRGTSPTRRRS